MVPIYVLLLPPVTAYFNIVSVVSTALVSVRKICRFIDIFIDIFCIGERIPCSVSHLVTCYELHAYVHFLFEQQYQIGLICIGVIVSMTATFYDHSMFGDYNQY